MANQRRSHGHIGRDQLVQRAGIELRLCQNALQAQQRFRAWRYDDGTHRRKSARILNLLVNRMRVHVVFLGPFRRRRPPPRPHCCNCLHCRGKAGAPENP
ncbi:MAG: hypothetical protein ACTS5V_06030 [Giesbergeria sp.]